MFLSFEDFLDILLCVGGKFDDPDTSLGNFSVRVKPEVGRLVAEDEFGP